MPRRKAQGINLQKRTVVVKSQNSAHNKKTLNFEKTKDTNDCIKQSSVKTPNRVPEFTTISSTEKNVDIPNDSYLHKKFKKIAEISASIAKTEKTENKVKNGFGNDDKRIESYSIDIVPKVEERILNNYNNLDVKGESNNSDTEGIYKNDSRQKAQQPQQPLTTGRSTSPVSKVERTKSPITKKDEAHLSANPGRYVCSYCQLACAKPSVLQKHIRAHTNERPYPCSPCGFAFKTKSNLYKHCRSQAHRFKTGEGQTGSEKCDSGEEMWDDSSSSPVDCGSVKSEPEPLTVPPTKTSEVESNESQHKIYKPKFHKAALYQDETESSNVKPRIQETGIQKKPDGEEKLQPKLKIPSIKEQIKPGIQSQLIGNKSLPPSPEFLQQHISKIISDNQAIVETMEPQWTKKFLQRQNSREKEMASPLSNISSPGLDHYQKYNLDLKKKDETKSKLALALSKVDKNEVNRYSTAYPKPEVNSDNHTYQPLNLTKKDSEGKIKYQTLGDSTIKEILIKSMEMQSNMGVYAPQSMAEMLSSLQSKEESYTKGKPENASYYLVRDGKSPEESMNVEAPYPSPGPLLGSTPLVEVKTETGPPPKKRRIHSTTYPPEGDLLYRRLSTSSLPCTSNGLITSPIRPSSSPSTTLKVLEELSKHPMKPSSLNMFGGEVKILDCGETKTMRIESIQNQKMPVESTEDNSKFFVTIAKTGLHARGETLVQVPSTTPQNSSFQIANILSYPDATKLLMPLIPNISAPNLTVPGVPPPIPQERFPESANIPVYGFDKTREKEGSDKGTSHNGGILTIVHGGKQIPYVPGIPGPQTILPTKVTENAVKKEEVKESQPATTTVTPTKSTVSSLISVRKLSSSNQPKNVPNEIPKIEISSLKSESKKEEVTSKAETGLKFLRPTSLPLRPGSFTPKRLHQGITPTVLSLVSPETPRPKKKYAQLFLNGHAYTYLELKCSTKSYYCTISRPQPMYVVQSAQHPKLSMYSNWKVYSESEPSLLGLTPAKAMAQYDSRHRMSKYTIADKNKASGSSGIVTHSSSWLKSADRQQARDEARGENEGSAWSGEAAPKRVKIFAGGYASNEDYTYVRGRGRGRYVCEECGIRCKKPSMLKKHIRTHTDVRPYTCKHCTFSFKTKGNLTKHMKSKAHYKKCMDMKISPIPTTVEAENIDEELLLKQQALRQDGNDESENEDEEDEDESDGGDEEETTTEDPESLEREAACSLISLSETTTRSSQYKSLYIAAGLIPKNVNAVRPSTYPYMTTKLTILDDQSDKESSRLDDSSQSYVKEKASYDNERPIDLSQKETKPEVNFLSKDSEFLAKPRLSESAKPAVSSTVPVPAYLLASVTNTGVQYDKINADLAGSHMLQAYLTAKALHDVKIKQQQNHKSRFVESNESDTENLKQFDKVSQLHQNFCRIYEKTVENETVNLKRFREDRNGLGVVATTIADSSNSVIVSDKVGENCRKVSMSDLNINKLVDINKLDEDKMTDGNSDGMEEKIETKTSEKSDNVSVTVETSSGKMILVSFPPAESERLSNPPTGFLSKPGDNKLKAEFFPPSSGPSPSYVSVTEDGRSICVMCQKVFTKASQLKLHVNIHYFERPFRCEPCAVSFRTKGHLLKHERSGSHHNKISMTSTFGTATTSNPRPFKCDDCKIAFRIHGHLAKHLRSKMHIMKLECIGKLPFGTYAEMERSGVNLNEIDTTDCENSLESLQVLAQKLYEKDPSKLGQLENSTTKLNHSTNEEEVTNSERDGGGNEGDSSSSDGYQFSLESPEKHNEESNELVCNNSRVSIRKEVLQFPDLGNKNRSKTDKVHGCTVCEERFDNLTSLQVHLFAEHNKDVKIDLLNKFNGKSEVIIEKTIKSNDESLIDNEKGK